MGRFRSCTFIFNPVADKGRASQKESWLKRNVSGLSGAALVTTAWAGHAGDLARSARRQGSDCLVACGGDGTLHEVVNAIAGSDVAVGVLPIGSANDFVKTLGSSALCKPLQHCFYGKLRRVDLGRVEFNQGERRFFVNSLGVGFTGRIADAVKQTVRFRGDLAYVAALFRVLVGYTPLKMHIKITESEGRVLEMHEPVFAFSVSNGKVEGGRFRIAPEADPADGLLDVCILKAIPKLRFFSYAVKYCYGTQIFDPLVVYCKARNVELVVSGSEVMHMDGEVFRTLPGRITVSVEPGALRVVV